MSERLDSTPEPTIMSHVIFDPALVAPGPADSPGNPAPVSPEDATAPAAAPDSSTEVPAHLTPGTEGTIGPDAPPVRVPDPPFPGDLDGATAGEVPGA